MATVALFSVTKKWINRLNKTGILKLNLETKGKCGKK